jgi:hypothetical protein
MTDLLNSVLEQYLRTYRGRIATERIDDNSVSLSFPFHFASNHRIEVVVTRATKDHFIISDSARIMTELRASGYNINKNLREKLEEIGKAAGLKLIREYLILDSTAKKLGDDIQRFLEAAKTIGDVYFVHRERTVNEKEITAKVKQILDSERVVYQQKYNVNGEIEPHKFDFFVPPNGARGLAIAILAAHNTHNAAQVWAFKTDDVKRQPVNHGLRVGIVYDTSQPWSDESKRILSSRADIVLTDQEVAKIAPRLHEKNPQET